jgi:GxxExxY protein
MKHQELTDRIICCFYNVYNQLGYGFLEKVYEKAMLIEMEKAGLKVQAQAPIRVNYDGQLVGEYQADLLIADLVIVELKATSALASVHQAQLLNYLKATEVEVGLLLNFGPQAEMKRLVFDNHKKSGRG